MKSNESNLRLPENFGDAPVDTRDDPDEAYELAAVYRRLIARKKLPLLVQVRPTGLRMSRHDKFGYGIYLVPEDGE